MSPVRCRVIEKQGSHYLYLLFQVPEGKEIYKVSELYKKFVTTAPAHTARPMKFQGHVIPEYFTATFYLVDNDGIKITAKNSANFKNTWVVELMLRVTKIETVEVVQLNVKGPKHNPTHDVFSTKPFDPSNLGTIQARHFNQLQENRSRFMSYAVTTAIQSHKYTKQPDGGHSWTIGDKIEVSEGELERVSDKVEESSYTKLDGNFYETFATRYKELARSGDKTPIKTLQALYYPEKSVKHVQSYATACRKKKLLPSAKQGKNSKVQKTTTRKGAK